MAVSLVIALKRTTGSVDFARADGLEECTDRGSVRVRKQEAEAARRAPGCYPLLLLLLLLLESLELGGREP